MYGFVENRETLPDGKSVIRYYMLMELLIGVSLEDFLCGSLTDQTGKSVPYAEDLYLLYRENRIQATAKIARSVLSGIMALHDKGFIHRDVDPSNIMITSDGKIKLIDLGICKSMSSLVSHDKPLTVDGVFLGKVDYAAPELILGNVSSQNVTTDIYSIGILIYQMFAGFLPFSGSDSEIMNAHLHKDPSLSVILHRGLRKIIKKATSKVQDKRYNSAAEMIVALEHLNMEQLPHFIGVKRFWWYFALAAIFCAGLFVCLRLVSENNSTEEIAKPAFELYTLAEKSIKSSDPKEVADGYVKIKSLASDSLYAPAVIEYYEKTLSDRDSTECRKALELMSKLARRDSTSSVIYECAMCMTNFSRNWYLPEVDRYSFVTVRDEIHAIELLDEVIRIEPYNYKAIFWKIFNKIRYCSEKESRVSEDDCLEMRRLYRQFKVSVDLEMESDTDCYEKLLRKLLYSWGII